MTRLMPSRPQPEDSSLHRPDDVPVDPLTPIGDASAEHANLRLACLREALAQSAALRSPRYADVLYRARLNARFVLEGRTCGLRAASEEGAEIDRG